MIETVRVERAGPVTTVLINRPEARNAVDGPTAAALADAFRAFEADKSANFWPLAIASITGRWRTATARWARRAWSCRSR
jgi:enoyl-CoA hydratase